MQRAGAAAAAEITNRFPSLLSRGVFVLAGPGNNGGDGWVVARALGTVGVEVNVFAPAGAVSPDCIAERSFALPFVRETPSYSGEGVVVDALLGTGSSGFAREPIASAREQMFLAGKRGASLVAIDLPSGLDATTGVVYRACPVDLTLTFGNLKRGHLVSRNACGTIVVLDIGFLAQGEGIDLVDAAWVRDRIPFMLADAHKGTRKKLLFQGGAPGMAGAAILGLRAALASGIGMVKARVSSSTFEAVHRAVPATLIDAWSDDEAPELWADVLVIGPGLGLGDGTRRAVERAIARHSGPVLLDADALTAFAGDTRALRNAIESRPALLTPHPVECARLLGVEPTTVLNGRFEIGLRLAKETGATVLLKGVPTIISAPDGRRIVVAEGTPTLATGGSGDILSGIAGTLLAQMPDAFDAAGCAAWIHGRAARLAGAFVRGTTLEEVLEMLPNAWRIPEEAPRYPVIAELPAVPVQ
jgi:ADP-dependent NAD(P)H-hydrate dehydratase / NAD(P)H-hydrate epimerase